jgi:putative hemolysin
MSLRDAQDRRSRTVVDLLRNPDDLLVTILLGNMVVTIFYASLAVIMAHAVAGYGKVAFGIEVAAFVVLIVAGEVVPKYITMAEPRRMSRFLAIPLAVFRKAAGPLVNVAGRLSRGISDFIVHQSKRPHVTAQEFDAILRLGEDHGVIDGVEEDLLQGVLNLKEIRACEVMTPRVDVAAVDIRTGPEDVRRIAREAKSSKLPVYDGNMDNIVGILRVKDLILYPEKSLRDSVRSVKFVPENASIGDLMVSFQEEKGNFAVVVDEYGGTSGIVTLEDVMEEVVGEIRDEYDRDIPPIRETGLGTYAVAGNLPLRNLNERFDAGAEAKGVVTVAGYIMARLDRPPAEGDQVRCGSLLLIVSMVAGRRVTEVRIEVTTR